MPSSDDYGQSIGLWSMTDAPSIPDAVKLLADGVIPRGVLRFASASARGAALSGATAPVKGMVSFLQDTNSFEVYDGAAWFTPQPSLSSTTSGLSAASGFSVNSFYGFRQGRVTTLDMYLARTGGNLPLSSGNLPDVVCCTVPSAWRPTHDTINGTWDNGVVGGGFVVGVDGICTLRTSDGTIESGTNLRMHVVFIKTT
jgi:hypothetical protein